MPAVSSAIRRYETGVRVMRRRAGRRPASLPNSWPICASFARATAGRGPVGPVIASRCRGCTRGFSITRGGASRPARWRRLRRGCSKRRGSARGRLEAEARRRPQLDCDRAHAVATRRYARVSRSRRGLGWHQSGAPRAGSRRRSSGGRSRGSRQGQWRRRLWRRAGP
jgi:hypothetical protein